MWAAWEWFLCLLRILATVLLIGLMPRLLLSRAEPQQRSREEASSSAASREPTGESFVEVSKLFLQLVVHTKAPPHAVLLMLSYAGVSVSQKVSRDSEVATREPNANFRGLFLPVKMPKARGDNRPHRKVPLFVPCAVTVQVSSHDQGWSDEAHSERGLRTSHTWLELALERGQGAGPHLPAPSTTEALAGDRLLVARNRHAVFQFEKHLRTWSHEQALVAALRRLSFEAANAPASTPLPSVFLSLYLRSQYPGWQCFCRDASIVVTYELVGAETLLGCLRPYEHEPPPSLLVAPHP
jgi:hypothetical protein